MFRPTVLFNGNDASGAKGLWVTNGTAAGTFELTGISGAQAGGLKPTEMTVFSGKVLFDGRDASGHFGLWVTDGTAAGTSELTGITGTVASGITPLHMTGFVRNFFSPPEVLFSGFDASGQRGLWVTNGTAAGTHEITGISGANAGGLAPSFMTVFPRNLQHAAEVLFNGRDANNQFGLWVTDGTAAGTHEITGITGAFAGGIDPGAITVFNGEVLFSGFDASGQRGLWVTNGTASGTHEITGVSGVGATGFQPFDMTVFNGEVLFNGYDASGSQGLWVTDGTATSTHELTGIIGASTTSGLSPSNMTVFDGEVLFNGYDASNSPGLWVTDGTAANTHELTGISGASTGGLNPSDMAVFNGEVLFNGYDASGSPGLWVTNGTAAGTHELTGISGVNTAGLLPQSMTPATLIVPPTDDFGGDNSSDILLQQNSGQLVLWEMIGTGVDPSINSGGLTFNGTAVFLGSDYRFLGTGDLNGDGRGDVLWQHATDGAIILWDMNGRAIDPINSGGVTLNGAAVSLGSDWHFLGTGDLNGDGRYDMLWQHATDGAIVLWEMNGRAIDPSNSGGVTLNGNAVSLGSDWHYLGTADFNDDGRSDMLWQNVNSGAVVLWDMNGGAINPGRSGGLTYNGSPVALGPDWHFVETGDLSGDNTSDILWQNVNGTFALWEMNGTTIDPGSGGGLTYNGNAIALGSDWHALV